VKKAYTNSGKCVKLLLNQSPKRYWEWKPSKREKNGLMLNAKKSHYGEERGIQKDAAKEWYINVRSPAEVKGFFL
jgi:hypothetical protein